MKKVGFTTTIPVEVVLAAGKVPVDLNNTFIASPESSSMVDEAENVGFPRTTCGWIKGLYVAAKNSGVDEVVAVTQGDCSNTHALMELWQSEGISIIPFGYPYDRDRDLLRLQIDKLAGALGATLPESEAWFRRLMPLREKLKRLDYLTYETGQVTGLENHAWLVSSSDFGGDPEAFEAGLDSFIEKAVDRKAGGGAVRLGYIGVPPIFTDLYDFVASCGADVVFNETQRQFSMPYDTPGLVEQYARYTYPYDVFGRIADIKEQVELRRLDGIIHYCQSFCFRAIEDLLIRRELSLPILTIEGDRPGPVDARTRLRVEGFIEMLADGKSGYY